MPQANIDEYKSPKHKLLAAFKAGRDTWKSRHAEAKRSVKFFKNRLRQVEASRDHWKDRAQRAERAAGLQGAPASAEKAKKNGAVGGAEGFRGPARHCAAPSTGGT